MKLVFEGAGLTHEVVMDRFASSGGFPDYFGRNWDALIDCLREPSGRLPATGWKSSSTEGYGGNDTARKLIDILGVVEGEYPGRITITAGYVPALATA